jgi:hypothetical protein
MPISPKVVRVGVMNNYNFTLEETQQLRGFEKAYPYHKYFINSNILTYGLCCIDHKSTPKVITFNPNITWTAKEMDIYLYLKRAENNLSFLRYKYVYGDTCQPSLHKIITHPIVYTMQRFKSKKTLHEYVAPEHHNKYIRVNNKGWYKLDPKYYPKLNENEYICDEKGLGCTECKLCSTLTFKQDLPIYSLNLSSSGLCKYNCPDCFAKCSEKQYNTIRYDDIYQNSKQRSV